MTLVPHLIFKPFMLALIICAITSVMFLTTSGIPALVCGLIAITSATYGLNRFMHRVLREGDYRIKQEN